MRIGNRLGMAVVGAVLAAATATLAMGADAAKRVHIAPAGLPARRVAALTSVAWYIVVSTRSTSRSSLTL